MEQVATVNDTQSRVETEIETEIETEKSRVEKEIEKEGETLAPASPEPPSDFKIFQDFWAKEFLERTGEKYLWMGAKDSKLVKGMLGSLGLETLKERAIALFESQDDFIIKAGKSIGVLHSCLNKLTSGNQKPKDTRPKNEFGTPIQKPTECFVCHKIYQEAETTLYENKHYCRKCYQEMCTIGKRDSE